MSKAFRYNVRSPKLVLLAILAVQGIPLNIAKLTAMAKRRGLKGGKTPLAHIVEVTLSRLVQQERIRRTDVGTYQALPGAIPPPERRNVLAKGNMTASIREAILNNPGRKFTIKDLAQIVHAKGVRIGGAIVHPASCGDAAYRERVGVTAYILSNNHPEMIRREYGGIYQAMA